MLVCLCGMFLCVVHLCLCACVWCGYGVCGCVCHVWLWNVAVCIMSVVCVSVYVCLCVVCVCAQPLRWPRASWGSVCIAKGLEWVLVTTGPPKLSSDQRTPGLLKKQHCLASWLVVEERHCSPGQSCQLRVQ